MALRAVETTDFMTAHWAPLPHELLARVSNRITNEVRGINRVVYDISGKPPATYKAGEVLLIPAGAIHWVKNVGSGTGAELATYVVEKGKPLVVMVK